MLYSEMFVDEMIQSLEFAKKVVRDLYQTWLAMTW